MAGRQGGRYNDVASITTGTFSQTYGSILTVILHINGVPCCWQLPPVPPNSCTTRALGRKPCGGVAAQGNLSLCTAARCCFNNTPAIDVHCFHQESPSSGPPPPAPSGAGGGAVMWGLVSTWEACRQHPHFVGCSQVENSLGPLLDYSFERFVSTNRQATYVNLQLSLDPFSDTGQAWVEYVRRELPTNGASV